MNPLKLFQRATQKTYDAIFPAWDTKDSTRAGKKSPTDFLRRNEISLYTNRALDKRAEKVGEIEFELRRGEEVVEKHKFLDLLRRPNRYHTGREFWKLYQKYLDITGAAFIYVHKTPRVGRDAAPAELHLLRSDLVRILFNSDGSEITGYDYKPNDGTPRHFEPDEIIYNFRPDPMHPLQGESLLRAGMRSIDTELQLTDYHANILANGGKIDGVFQFEDLTSDQLKQVKESYQDQYGEAKKAGLPLFLGGKTKYERLALNPEELSFLETKRMTLGDICLMTGVPRSILSQTSDETFANAEASIKIFLRETIKPLLEGLSTMLDWRLIPEGFDLTFVDPTPEDVDRKLSILKAAHETNTVTINEKREMLDLEPIEGGDSILIPFSVVPLERAHEEPEEEPEQEPNEEEDEPEEEESKKTAKVSHPLRDPETRRKYAQIVEKRADRRESRFNEVISGYFEDQRTRLLDRIEGAKHFRRKDLFDESFDLQAEIRIAKGLALPLIEQFLLDAGNDTMSLVGSSQTFTLSADIRSWMDHRAEVFAGEITSTTFDKLKREFTDSVDAGETRQELIGRITTTYDGFTENRAKVIARTEVHSATQKGTWEGYRQTNMPIKIWTTVGDAQVRDSHSSIDGEEVPFNQPFSNGLQYPGDDSAPASETVNCRCSI